MAPLAILGALGVHLLTHAAGSPLVNAATSALTAPLTRQLELTGALAAAAAALLLAAPLLMPHRDTGTNALAPRKRRSGSCGPMTSNASTQRKPPLTAQRE